MSDNVLANIVLIIPMLVCCIWIIFDSLMTFDKFREMDREIEKKHSENMNRLIKTIMSKKNYE